MSKTDKPDYDQKGTRIYILIGKFKGHKTWRIVFSGSNMKTLQKIQANHNTQIEEWKIRSMDGLTAEIF